MSEIPERLQVSDPIGKEALERRLDRLWNMHKIMLEQMEANQREYEAIQERDRQIIVEYDHLRRKLSYHA